MSTTSQTDDPLAIYNELCLAGTPPDVERFCAEHRDHPSLALRIAALVRLQQDLRRLVQPPAPESTSPVAPPGFRVLRPLGAGGMGSVYLAEQEHPRRLTALKLMARATPESRARFSREADLAARLSHKNVAAVYLYGVHADVPYLATEYVHGFSLAALLQVADLVEPSAGIDWVVGAVHHLGEGTRAEAEAVTPGPVPAMLRLCRQIADALGVAHEHGVIHRDVKPGNIMIGFDGTPKLIDFGIAFASDSKDGRVTRAGSFVGSFDYAAPEQLVGDVDQIGPWTDTYALGATLFEMLTLRTPFECASFADRLAIARAPLPHGPRFYNPAVSPTVDALVLRALAPDPAARFQDGREIEEALQLALTVPRIMPRLAGRYLTPLFAVTKTQAALAAAVFIAALLALALADEHGGATLAAGLARSREHQIAREVLAWHLEHGRETFQKCLPAEHRAPDLTKPRGPMPLPLRFAATLTIAKGSVLGVENATHHGIGAKARQCLTQALGRLELPGVGMSEPVTLVAELRWIGDLPLEHSP
ncbi:MAG: serine/threonine protein kinase [Deltaproteobacteria bacterium]|nr:serine/threonine protein kinase [Deltaproteobacteria bacterium]